MTILGHPEDKFIGQRDRLAANPELVAKYNALKMRFEGRDANDYRAAKWEFIETYLVGAENSSGHAEQVFRATRSGPWRTDGRDRIGLDAARRC